MNLYTHAESNTRKTWVYLTFFFVFIVGIGFLASYVLGSSYFLIAAVGLSILMSFGSYWYSDKMVLAMTKAKPLEKAENIEVYRIVENLAITAGLPTPKLYILEERQPNAFATGRDARHAVVAVTRGLIERLDKTELEGVLAHEMSHIGNKDILLSTIVVVLVGFVAIVSDFIFRISFGGGLGSRDEKRGGMQMQGIFLVVGLVFLFLAPVIAQLVKLGISRKREFLADASGALLTRYPEGLAKALEKISQDPFPMKSANDALAHLYIASPFKGKEQASWIHKLFMTHPPMEQRIAVLRGMRV